MMEGRVNQSCNPWATVFRIVRLVMYVPSNMPLRILTKSPSTKPVKKSVWIPLHLSST